jgi:hypothetical protein
MKKFFFGALALISTAIITPNIYAQGCTRCTTASTECYRIIMEGPTTEVHIFHGIKSSCTGDQ